jgi:hypothetical protein
MIYLVQGRRFAKRPEAITFAEGLAAEQGTSVDVMVEVEVIRSEVKRSWICRMHPPGFQRTILKTAPNAAFSSAGRNNA